MRLSFAIILCIAAMTLGCTSTTSLSKDQKMIDVSSRSLILFTVKVANQSNQKYQPFPYMLFFDGTSGEAFTVKESGPHRSIENASNEYLLSFDLKPGKYTLNKIWFDYHGTFLGARASVPMNMDFNLRPNCVMYLGHINTVLRQKKDDNESSAGSSFPIVNQAVAGFSGAGYDVTVEDNYAEDMKWFKSEYPALQTVTVEKAIFPQWMRPRS
ncbi:MAG TPA: hypothetical protein VK452_04585 [Dissulfurispiraceae bacterium]|nr:hypothetical protein [Dissulfurispiraceae bacterium]